MGGINRKTRSRSRLLRDYMRAVEGTDKLPPADLEPALMGLYGEVGSVMASTKNIYGKEQLTRDTGKCWKKSSGIPCGT